MTDLSILIVNYNTVHLLEQCLASIYDSKTRISYEIIVVDNASHDHSVAMILEKFPQVKLIKNNENLGFAAAANMAIKQAQGKYLLIFNPDIIVKQTDSIQVLYDFMETYPEAGIVGGQLIYPDGQIQHSCSLYQTPFYVLASRTYFGEKEWGQKIISKHRMRWWPHNHVREVDWFVGACMMFRREVIEEIGLMDEAYFMYCEDMDFCYRAKQAGWQVYYVPDAKFIHKHLRHSAKKFFSRPALEHMRSGLTFFLKYPKFFFKV